MVVLCIPFKRPRIQLSVQFSSLLFDSMKLQQENSLNSIRFEYICLSKLTIFETLYIDFLSMRNIRRQDNNPLIPKSTKSINLTESEAKGLRKIDPDDKFPCYSCFDQPIERFNCTVCNKMGFIMGNHPMVKFVDDFLTQNLTSHLKMINQSKDTYANDSHSSDEEFLEKRSPLTKRIECRSALQSYQIRDSGSSTEPQPIGSLREQVKEEQQNKQIHYGFKCDQCDQTPIKGIRYNCPQCQDYDVCRNCYLKANHFHQMDEIKGKKNVKMEVSQMIQNLKKSTRNRN